MLQPEIRDRSGDARRLHKVILGRPAARDGAKRTGARADVTENHERCSPMLAPAFSDVGAHRVFADGIELVGPKNAANLKEVLTAGNPDFEPVGPVTHM